MKKTRTSRRRFLQLTAGATVVSGAGLSQALARASSAAAIAGADAIANLGDDRILIEFDSNMRSRLWHLGGVGDGHRIVLTRWAASESLMLADGLRCDRFALREHAKKRVNGPFGAGSQLRMVGLADTQIEKTLEVELLERYPGFAIYRVSYRNLAPHAIAIRSWTNAALQVSPERALPPTS